MKKLLSVFICTYIVLLPFTSTAQAWQQVSDIPAVQVTALFSLGDTLFTAGENRIYFTYDGGENWDSTAVVHPGVDFIETLHYGQGRLYAGTVVNGVFRSDNGGQSWQADNAGLTGLGALNSSCLESRGDSLYLATYGAGIFVKKLSTNSNWTKYSVGLPWSNVESLTHIEGKLYAGAGSNATVSTQAPPGHAWTETIFDSLNGEINSILDVLQQGNVLLAAASQGLYRSTDGGETWSRFDPGTGLLGAAHFVGVGNRVIASLTKPTGQSFMRYTDNQGLDWKNFEPSLTGSIGYDLEQLNGSLYSARSNGLWRFQLYTPVNEPIKVLPSLGRCFPNPFSGAATIPVNLPNGGWASLFILNSMGEVVENLWSGEQTPGDHQVVFEAGNLPSGTYFCRLVTLEGAFTQKIMLVR